MPFFAAVYAAFGRAMVGAGKWSRWFVYPPVALFSAWVGFGWDWWAVPFGVATAIAMAMGFTKWENWTYMVLRYGAVPFVLTVVYTNFGAQSAALAAWVMASMLVGALYSKLQAVDPRFAEAVAGGILIGGMAFKGLF